MKDVNPRNPSPVREIDGIGCERSLESQTLAEVFNRDKLAALEAVRELTKLTPKIELDEWFGHKEATYAKFLQPNFERIPAELKKLRNWVLWYPVWTGTKWTKRPIQPSGFGASTTNPKHWCSFEEAKQAYECALRLQHGDHSKRSSHYR